MYRVILSPSLFHSFTNYLLFYGWCLVSHPLILELVLIIPWSTVVVSYLLSTLCLLLTTCQINQLFLSRNCNVEKLNPIKNGDKNLLASIMSGAK